jgi:hypothetical protein
VPEPEHITDEARRRLEALQRFTELGAGFQIASQDLEIRGGGELLGAKQSGSIAYRAAARFIEKTRDLFPSMIYSNVSFVGSTALAEELKLLGPRYTNGVIVTQVVPAVSGYSSAVLEYKNALAKYFPGEAADYVSFEGYIAANVLIAGIKRAGPQLDTEKLIDTLETMRNLDLGLGTQLSFGRSEHQASNKVWGTALDESGRYQPLDLE